jgi:hypothetical protein
LSMTWELGVAFHEACQDFQTSLPSLIESLEYLASIAPQPYMLGQGPDIIAATVIPNVVVEGDTVTLMITASDAAQQAFVNVATSAQDVVEIHVYMNHPLVVGNEHIPAVWMWNASDHDDWSQSEESNGVVVVSTVLSWEDVIGARGPGNHVWYIQALDSDGHWGPVTAIPITVMGPEGLLPESKLPISSLWSSSPSLAPSLSTISPTRIPSLLSVTSRPLSRSPTTSREESNVIILSDNGDEASHDSGMQQPIRRQPQATLYGAKTVVIANTTRECDAVMNGATKQWILPHVFQYRLEELTNTSVSFLIFSSVSNREE